MENLKLFFDYLTKIVFTHHKISGFCLEKRSLPTRFRAAFAPLPPIYLDFAGIMGGWAHNYLVFIIFSA